MGRQVGVEYLPAREEVLHAFSDHSRTWRVFGRRSCVDLEEGLHRMARWAETIEPALPMLANNRIEIAKNLPASWARLRRPDAAQSNRKAPPLKSHSRLRLSA